MLVTFYWSANVFIVYDKNGWRLETYASNVWPYDRNGLPMTTTFEFGPGARVALKRRLYAPSASAPIVFLGTALSDVRDALDVAGKAVGAPSVGSWLFDWCAGGAWLAGIAWKLQNGALDGGALV